MELNQKAISLFISKIRVEFDDVLFMNFPDSNFNVNFWNGFLKEQYGRGNFLINSTQNLGKPHGKIIVIELFRFSNAELKTIIRDKDDFSYRLDETFNPQAEFIIQEFYKMYLKPHNEKLLESGNFHPRPGEHLQLQIAAIKSLNERIL